MRQDGIAGRSAEKGVVASRAARVRVGWDQVPLTVRGWSVPQRAQEMVVQRSQNGIACTAFPFTASGEGGRAGAHRETGCDQVRLGDRAG